MTDISTSCKYLVANNNFAAKQLLVDVDDSSVQLDTIAITLADYGISTFMGCVTLKHTTDSSVLVLETTYACTTAVSAGVLTLTIPTGATDSQRRTVIIFGV